MFPFLAFCVEGGAVEEFHPWKAGSISEAMYAELSPVLDVVRSRSNTELFSVNNRNTASPTVSLSPDLWCAGVVDLSPISVITNGHTADDRFPVILVHERFVYSAAHVRGSGPYVFRAPDGTLETRTVLEWKAYPTLTLEGAGVFPDGNVTRDAAIGILSAPITTIEPARVLPEVWREYFPPPPPTYDGYGFLQCQFMYMPALWRRARTNSGEDWARINVCAISAVDDWDRDYMDFSGVSPTISYFYPTESTSVGASQQYPDDYDMPIGGDSGSPVFYVLGGKMVLMGALYSATSFPSLMPSLGVLTTWMNELGTSYSVPGAGSLTFDVIDLSGYATYP